MPLSRSLIIAAAALILRASVATGVWTVDADGACVEQWATSDLLRGPTAILNGPVLPFRTTAGGAVYAWNTKEWWPVQIVVLGPVVTFICTVGGVVEGVWWMGTGLTDTLTGGYFGLAPEKATELAISPVVPIIIADASPTPTEDHCGRPLQVEPEPSPAP